MQTFCRASKLSLELRLQSDQRDSVNEWHIEVQQTHVALGFALEPAVRFLCSYPCGSQIGLSGTELAHEMTGGWRRVMPWRQTARFISSQPTLHAPSAALDPTDIGEPNEETDGVA